MKKTEVRWLVKLAEEGPPQEMLYWIEQMQAYGWRHSPSLSYGEDHYSFMYYAARLLSGHKRHVLELGRFKGASTRWLYKGKHPNCMLITVDNDDSKRDPNICPAMWHDINV